MPGKGAAPRMWVVFPTTSTHLQPPQYGQMPDNYSLRPGEVQVPSRPQQGQIWDANTQTVRTPTPAEQLSIAKENKENELRNAANAWYETHVRSFEGAVVIHKIDRALALNAEEQAIRDAMTANYTRLKNLITQVRAATTLAQVEQISWEG